MKNTLTSSEKEPLDHKKLLAQMRMLIQICKDGQAGFRTAAKGVRSSDVKALFIKYANERASFVETLQLEILRMGGDPDKAGSLTSSLHRGWINLKSALASGDEAIILAECERGEDVAEQVYKDASLLHLPPNIKELVSQQFACIRHVHERVLDMVILTKRQKKHIHYPMASSRRSFG
jgi:uncharacterized protein (TIGR02284 family)